MVRFDFEKYGLILLSRSIQWIIVLLIFCFLPITTRAQQLIYDHFGIREGISNRLVSDVVYDHQGLIWVATANGLNRFDGYNFVTFSTSNKEGKHKLSHARIRKLALAPDGKIFIFYEDLYSSFDVIDPLTFDVEKIEIALEVAGNPRAIYTNKEGVIHILSKKDHYTNIYTYDYHHHKFIQVCQVTEYWNRSRPNVNLVQTANNNYVVYDVEMGLRIIKPENKTVKYLSLPTFHGIHEDNPPSLSFLHRSNDDTIWLSYSNRNGIFQLEEQNETVTLLQSLPSSLKYTNIWEDEVGNLIFNQAIKRGNYPVSQHLFCLQKNGKISDFSYLIDVGHFILTMSGHDFFQSIFIGNDTGLKIVQNSTTRVEQYFAQNINMNSRGFSMRGMCSDGKGSIFLSREVSFWYKLDLKTNLLDTILLYDNEGELLNFSRSQGIVYDTTGYIWGITGDGSDSNIGLLHQYDIENCTNVVYKYSKNFSAYAMQDQRNIWMGTHTKNGRGTLIYFDIIRKEFVTFQDQQGFNPFDNTIIKFILSSDDNILWIGTEQGLFWVNTRSKQWNHYKKDTHPQFPNAQKVNLSDDIIYNLFLDDNETLWIGTLNGLTRFDTQENTWKTYYKDDGLASNTIAYILPGKDNSLWVSTYNGLSHFTPDEDQSRQFFSINGFSHNEFNRFSGLIDENGRYYFGGVNGINAFYPADLLATQNIPKVLLTAFTYYDSKIDSIVTQYSGLNNSNSDIIIEPYIRFFSFDFALPIYTPTTDNQFKYKMGKETTEWIHLKKGHSLRFNDLKPGRYAIYVQGADSSGNWSSESFVINVWVKQAFYSSWLFLFLISIILLIFAYGLLRYRLEEKLRMERLRTQLASDLHDEVSGLLAGISLQSELLRSQVKEESIALKLGNIRQASQRAMSKMSDVIWSIDSRRDRIADLILRMEEHADEVLLPLNIRYQLDTQDLDHSSAIPANIRQDLYFIYKESINNIAKHANATLVTITMENNGAQFEMQIKDNGFTKNKSEDNQKKFKRKGQGLSNLRMRAQRLNAQLNILVVSGYTIELKMKRFS